MQPTAGPCLRSGDDAKDGPSTPRVQLVTFQVLGLWAEGKPLAPKRPTTHSSNRSNRTTSYGITSIHSSLKYEYAYNSGNSAIQLVKVFSAVLGSSHSTQHCEAVAGSGRGGGGKEEEEEEEIVVSVR